MVSQDNFILSNYWHTTSVIYCELRRSHNEPLAFTTNMQGIQRKEIWF